MKTTNFIFFLILILAPALSPAQTACRDDLDNLPIQAGGRVKPLSVHAKETLKLLTGKTKPFEDSTVVTYCKLSLAYIDSGDVPSILLKFEHQDTAKLLDLPLTQKQIDPDTVRNHEKDIRQTIGTLGDDKKNSAFSSDLKMLLKRLSVHDDILAGHDFTLPIIMDHKADTPELQWVSLAQLSEVMLDDLNTKATMVQAAITSAARYTQVFGDHFMIEYYYDKLAFFHWAMLAVLVTLALVFVTQNYKNPGVLVSLAILFALQIVAITMRVMISGRGPVTNMYETVMWVGGGAIAFATLLMFIRKDKTFLIAGLVMNLLALFMMNFVPSMVDPSIQPLVPVLRDNFWLSTHVTCITISYAALSLSWLIANYYMLRNTFKPFDAKQTGHLALLCYDSIKIGVVLLAAGIILGGIWADYSWGRFWGWDPKETWALIALLCYIAVLHGRYAGWIPHHRFLPCVAVCYLSIIMAWFGVNYILAAGLHSYGFSSGGAIFIALIVGLQLLILGVYLGRRRSHDLG